MFRTSSRYMRSGRRLENFALRIGNEIMIDAKDLGEDLKVKAAIDLVKEKAVITVA